MSLTPDWMTTDNLGHSATSRARRARRRALDVCIMGGLIEWHRGKVGYGFARVKERLEPDELAALQSITSFDNDPYHANLLHSTASRP